MGQATNHTTYRTPTTYDLPNADDAPPDVVATLTNANAPGYPTRRAPSARY
jgi:hypothetical protein